ncbi:MULTISPECIES: tail completion protein gp17 [Stenotrophomonas]|uniref:tail completion protein gp17 n=1 Tax=Stenotrophomonas TaxID=40323 RepID=UPI001F1FACAC|nr:DUF3168 domain-containing protein [Stenotrophomonas maltophilia]MCF3519770.1 DUF3168 domain-containing protein [Stenotrophomonas maltophilia]
MFPKVYRTIRTAAVSAIVDDRIGRHGEVAQTETRPYIVWQIVTGSAFDNLSASPGGDFTTVQIDCYHATDAGVEQLAKAVRAALDGVLIVNRVVVNNRDPDTKLYRVGLEADFIDQR